MLHTSIPSTHTCTHTHTYTPVLRLVYRWFLFVYQVTYFLGIVGYLILMLVFTGVGFLLPFNPDSIVEVSRMTITLPNSIVCGLHQMAIMWPDPSCDQIHCGGQYVPRLHPMWFMSHGYHVTRLCCGGQTEYDMTTVWPDSIICGWLRSRSDWVWYDHCVTRLHHMWLTP